MVNLAIRLSVALICAPRYGIAFVWLAVPAGWLANFIISYAALRKSWPKMLWLRNIHLVLQKRSVQHLPCLQVGIYAFSKVF